MDRAGRKLQKQIDIAFDNDDFYTASQCIRSQYSRGLPQSAQQALSALLSGAAKLAARGEVVSSIELVEFACQTQSFGDGSQAAVTNFLSGIDDLEARATLAAVFIRQPAVQCAAMLKAQLHDIAANARCEMEDWSTAVQSAMSGYKCDSLLPATIGWLRTVYSGETPFLLTKIVLQLLRRGRLGPANSVFKGVLAARPTVVSTDEPLVHFAEFSLKACERDAGPLFDDLLRVYLPSLRIDPEIESLAHEVGATMFGLKPAAGGVGDMGQLMNSMMGMLSGTAGPNRQRQPAIDFDVE